MSVSLALGKAEQGNITSLTRATGIVIPKYTSAVAALTKQHEFAVNSGVKYSASQKEQYTQMLATAAATDAATRKNLAFTMVREQFQGLATHSGGAAAAMARFRVILHQLSVQVGTALLPSITSAATALGGWIEHLRESGEAAETAKGIASGLGTIFRNLTSVAHLVGPPLGLIARALKAIASVGGTEILGMVVAMKALGTATHLVDAAKGRLVAVQAIYLGTAPKVAAANLTDTETTAALTGALTANTAAMTANAGATGVNAAAKLRLGGATATAAGGLGAASTTSAASSIAKTGAVAVGARAGIARLGTSLLALAGGPVSAVILGFTAAALVTKHFVDNLREAQHEADVATARITSANSLALTWYSTRVKALMRDRDMGRAAAKELAEKETFAHTGIHVGPATATVAAALGQDTAATSRAKALTAKSELAAIVASVKEARQTLRTAIQDLADAEQGVADAIRSGHEQVRQSIIGAMSNLASIGDTLAGTIQEFIDKVGTGSAGVSAKDSGAFKRLRDQIASGDAAPGAAAAASALANQMQQSQAVASQKGGDAKRDIADLVAEFNKGSITLAAFNKRLAGILAKDGITYGKAGKALGVSFADGFRAQVQGLKDQAGAIAATPRSLRAGLTGKEPNIIRPLDAIRDSNRAIAAAQRAQTNAQLAVKKATEDLKTLEIAHNRAMRNKTDSQIHEAKKTNAHLKVLTDDAKRRAAKDKRDEALAKREARLRIKGNPGDGRIDGTKNFALPGMAPIGGP